MQELFESVKARDPAQPEFLQAVEEVRLKILHGAISANQNVFR